MELCKLKQSFSVCKLNTIDGVDFSREFVFLSKTDDELSLVCESQSVPPDAVETEDGWTALKIPGVLDFGMIGVIAGITRVLQEAGMSVFVISTYNTDYFLIKNNCLERASELLEKNGYTVTCI